MQLFDSFLYSTVHLIIVSLFSIYYSLYLNRKNAISLFKRRRTGYLVLFYSVLFIIVVGLRPNSAAFGDTVTVARTYQEFTRMADPIVFTRDSLFYLFMWWCSRFLSVSGFFLILEIIYIVPMMIACYRFYKKNTDIGLLFCLAAFSFWAYAVNGMRNGAACSLVVLSISLIQGNIINKIIAAVSSIIAIGFHTSAILPVLCIMIALIVRKRQVMFFVWGISILISLAFGNSISSFFANLGFDDRLSYIQEGLDGGMYTKTGFRWDFLLYSAVPIILGYYIVLKKKVYDSVYLLLLGTYIYANSFWIMVIRAEYSNRFAYLSWFLYPFVLSYPLLKLRIWPKTQGSKVALIMTLHLAFTLIMFFVF